MNALQAAFEPSVAILRQGVLQRLRAGSNPASWMLIALAMLAMLVVGLPKGYWLAAIALGAGIPLFVLALLWWGYIHAGVVAQNRSSGRRMVPGLRRRSLQAVFGLWAVLVLLFSALFAIYFGASLVPLAVVATMLSVVAICTLDSFFGAVFFLVFTFAPLAVSTVLPAATVMRILPYVAAWAAPVVTALWVWMEYRLLERSWFGLKLSAMGLPQFRLQMRASADLAGANRGELMLFACGFQSVHYFSVLLQGAFWMLITLLFFKQTMFVLVSAVGFHLTYAFTMRTRLLSKPDEQSLARLAPHAPSTAQFNRVLARALLQRFMMTWALTSIAAVAAIAWIARDLAVVQHSLMVLGMTLPAAVLFLCGYGSRFKRIQVALSMLGLALLMTLSFVGTGKPVQVQAAMLAAVLAATALLIGFALRRLGAAPVTFPFGRLR